MWRNCTPTHRSRDTPHVRWLRTHCQWYPMRDVRTHNSRPDRLGVFKFGGGNRHSDKLLKHQKWVWQPQDAFLHSYIVSRAHSQSFWRWRAVQLWQVIIFIGFVFVGKTACSIYVNKCNSGFPVSPGSAEAQARWDGKIFRLLIACFLSNISAKHYQNRFMFVFTLWHKNATILCCYNFFKVIATQNSGIFETQCKYFSKLLTTLFKLVNFS